MFSRPSEPSDNDVIEAVTTGWGLEVDEVGYRAVGFGSYHWAAAAGADRFFVTVDDLQQKRRSADDTQDRAFARLATALELALHASDAGLEFVVAPLRAEDGAAVRRLAGQFAVAVYPHIDGHSTGWGGYESSIDRDAVVQSVAQLHRLPIDASRSTDFRLQARDAVADALTDLESKWDTGPFGEPARRLVVQEEKSIRARLDRFDQLVEVARKRPDHRALTHGEPHSGNVIRTAQGCMLVDWDTAAVAPPERDMWMLDGDDEVVAARYASITGNDLVPELLALYRLTWDLADLGLALREFRAPHSATEDAAHSWRGFEAFLNSL